MGGLRVGYTPPMSTPSRRSALKLLASAFVLPLLCASVHAQEWAKTRLEASPRHHEYVTLKHGDRSLQAFVVYPEVKQKATVVVLIHEIFGLSDWAKEMADELAGDGYIVIAPDLLSGGSGPNASGTPSYPDQDAVVKAVSGLDPAQVTADLDAAADFGRSFRRRTARRQWRDSAGAAARASRSRRTGMIFRRRSCSTGLLPRT